MPPTAEAGTTCIDKSDAFRLAAGIPLVVPGVNDDALNGGRIVANPNCSAIQLTCVLKPLHDAAGLARVRLATYQSMSGAGDAGIERLRATEPMQADLAMDWPLVGEEYDEEYKLRAETRKILGLSGLPLQAACVRVPVLVGHCQAIWVETEDRLSPEQARDLLAQAPHIALADAPNARRSCRPRRGARRPDPPRPDRAERARTVGRERQPPQGRRAQRGSDRGGAAPAPGRTVSGLSPQARRSRRGATVEPVVPAITLR